MSEKLTYAIISFLTGEFMKIDDDYIEMLYQLGVWSLYSDENGDFEGKLLGVDQIGQLRIENRSGGNK